MNKNLKRTALSMVLTVALMPSVTFASYEEDQKALQNGRMSMTGSSIKNTKAHNTSTVTPSVKPKNTVATSSTNATLPPVDTGSKSSVIQGILKQAYFWHDKLQLNKALQALNRVLLSDPHNEEALYLMSLWSGEVKDEANAKKYRDKLAKISPNSSYLMQLDNKRGMDHFSQDKLTHARALAASGNIQAAIFEYQKLFAGAIPPKALVSEYYMTMSSDPNYYDRACMGIINYIKQNPKDINAQITYGKILTYRKSSIRKGIELLDYYSEKSDEADKGLRQALLWLMPNEEDSKYYEKYTKRHPNDNEIKTHFENTIIGKLSQKAYSDAELDKKDAIDSFLKILKKNPNNQDALEAVGYLYSESKEYLKAQEYLSKAAALGGKKEANLKHDAKMASINLAVATGDLSQAIQNIDELLAQSPYDLDALLLKADICKKQKNYPEAEKALKTALSAQPNNEGVNEILYYLYREQGKMANANSLLASMSDSLAEKIKQAISPKAYVDPIPPLRNKAQSLISNQQYPQAIEFLQQAISKHPNSSWLRYDLAKLIKAQGFEVGFNNQVQYLTRANASSEDLFAAANLYNEFKDYKKALNTVKRINNPQDKVLKFKQELLINQSFDNIEKYLKQGNTLAAYNSLQMLQVTPAKLSDSQLGHLAYLNLRCGQKDRALELANIVASKPIPQNASISDYTDIITVFNETGNYDLANSFKQNQSLLSNTSSEDLDKLSLGDTIKQADTLRELKRYADAYDLLFPKLQQHPENADLNLAMARLYQDNQDNKMAQAIYEKVLQKDGSNQTSLEGAINVALAAEEYEKAALLATKIQGNTNDPRVLTLLARVDAKNKNYQGAISKLTRARSNLDSRYAYKNATTNDPVVANKGQLHQSNNPFKNKAKSSVFSNSKVTLPWENNTSISLPKNTYFMTNAEQSEALADINFMIRDLQDKVSTTVQFGLTANQKDGEDGLSKLKTTTLPIKLNLPMGNGARLTFTAEPIHMDSGNLRSEGAIFEHGSNALQVGVQNLISEVNNVRTGFNKLLDGQEKAALKLQQVNADVHATQAQKDTARANLDYWENAIGDFTSNLNISSPEEQKALLGYYKNGTDIVQVAKEDDLFSKLEQTSALQTAQGRKNLINFLKAFDNPKDVVQMLNTYSQVSSLGSRAKPRKSSGVAFNAALIDDDYKFDLGVTPIDKDGTNFEAGAFYNFKVGNYSNLRLKAERRGMRDSQLSYFGYKDDMSGTYWGAVTKNGGEVTYAYDDGFLGASLSGSAYTYRGHNVQHNSSFGLNATAYVHPIRPTEYEDLTVGLSLSYQDFKHNQNHFSFGHGGYFSPQNYLIASIPVNYRKRTEQYYLTASAELGYQTYTQAQEDYYPTNADFQNTLTGLYQLGLVKEDKYAKKTESGIGGSLKVKLDYYILDDLILGGNIGYSTFGEYKEMSEMLYIKSVLGQ